MLLNGFCLVLKVLYKGKGDPQDPNNSRGIALKETSAKVLSIVIAKRLLRRFKEIDPSSQFGHVGCQEAQHIIKKALLLRRQHGIESYAVFVDLVKAFDTVHHQLLCLILTKYGFPASLVETIRKLYNDCKVKIQVGSKSVEIDYTQPEFTRATICPLFFSFLLCTPFYKPSN